MAKNSRLVPLGHPKQNNFEEALRKRSTTSLSPDTSHISMESFATSGASGFPDGHHRKSDTVDSSSTLISLEDALFCRRPSKAKSFESSLTQECSGARGGDVVRRSTITSLTTLTDPRVFKMHDAALFMLKGAQRTLRACSQDPSRSLWEEAARKYRDVAKTAPHVELWASHYWRTRSRLAPSDSSMLSGVALLPGWNSFHIILGDIHCWTNSAARAQMREEFIKDAERCIALLVDRQSAVLEQLYMTIDQAQHAQQLQIEKMLRGEQRRRDIDRMRKHASHKRRSSSQIESWHSLRSPGKCHSRGPDLK